MSRDGFNSSDFRHIFEHSITVKDIAEPLVSFDHKKKAESIIRFMEDKQFDVVGVTQKGLVCGFALKTELAGGQLSK